MPRDGFYDMCQVVPSEGPRIRTGASSGPSKRYCMVFGGVSVTRKTLSSVTRCHIAGVDLASLGSLTMPATAPGPSLKRPGVAHRHLNRSGFGRDSIV